MILFGSQVSGEADENSDIDLIVVGDEFKDKTPLKRGGCNLIIGISSSSMVL